MVRNCTVTSYLLTAFLALIALGACAGNSNEHFPASSSQSDIAADDAVLEIEGLQPPEGVDPELFAELKSGLIDSLAGQGKDRFVSTAPSGSKNAVDDLWLERVDATTATAHWTYINVGDYNQDSEVGVADITPIAQHYRKTPESPDWGKAQLADGDSNGEVNAADISQIAANYRSTVSAYSLQMTTTPEEESSWTEVMLADFDISTEPDGGGKRQFSIEVAAEAGQSFRVVPMSGAAAGVPGLPYDYDGEGGTPTMPFEERDEIMDEINTELLQVLGQFMELPLDERIEKRAEAMVTFLEGIEDVVDPHVFGDCAWATFSDGRPLVVITNRESQNESEALGMTEELPEEENQKQTSIIYPQGKTALLFDGTQGQGIPTLQYKIVPGLEARGYDVVQKSMTIDELLNVGGEKPVSIVQIDSHGVISGNGGFHLVSSTPVSQENDEAYIDFHNDLSLFYGLDSGGKHYGLTDSALADIEWGLTPGAVVFLNCCNGGTDQASSFRERLLELGAATVLGWDSSVDNNAANVRMLQLYDDALGVDTIEISNWLLGNYADSVDTPKMRPFSLQSIMNHKGNNDLAWAAGGRDVRLHIFGADSVLAPSISRFWILEPAATPDGPSAPYTLLRLSGSSELWAKV